MINALCKVSFDAKIFNGQLGKWEHERLRACFDEKRGKEIGKGGLCETCL